MFTLDNRFTFRPNTDGCWLAATIGYHGQEGVSWHLHLHSEPAHISLIPPEERCSGWDQVSFGIDCDRLALNVTDWKELPGRELDLPENSLGCAFSIFQWEDLVSLRLRFGEAPARQIEVSAEGTGLAESLPEWFPDGAVSFQIQAWATFTGVTINVPLDAGDAVAYAQCRIRELLPAYVYGQPGMRRTDDEHGKARIIEVLCPPG